MRTQRTIRTLAWEVEITQRCACNRSTRRGRQECVAILGYAVKHCLRKRQGIGREGQKGKKIHSQIMNNTSKMNADPHSGSRKRKWCPENTERLEIKPLHRNGTLRSCRCAHRGGKVLVNEWCYADHASLLSTFLWDALSSRTFYRLDVYNPKDNPRALFRET